MIVARRLAALTSLTALLVLAACSGGDEPEAEAPPPSTDEVIAAQAELLLEGTAGRWARVRPGAAAEAGLTDEQRRRIRRLESLGYVAGSRPAPAARNVVRHDAARAVVGLNLYTSGHAPEAVLMDMDGQVLHRWSADYRTVWPDSAHHPDQDFWRRARLLPGGELLAIVDGFGLMKLDARSQVIWARHNGAHHDLEVLPDGDILVLVREARVIRRVHPRNPVLEDFIVRLGPDGLEKQRVSILESFENSAEFGRIWDRAQKRSGDAFHTNSLEMLDGDHAGRVLISIRELDTIAIVDLDRIEVVWAQQGPFATQHDATVLEDGNIMLFNNLLRPGVSAVQILDPATGGEVWSFAGTAERPFYSRTCGTSQPLAGGNVLITESDNGRAFEITRDGAVVWEFFNPHRAGDQGEYIATLFEMLRLPADLDVSWADGVH